ncbi:MAG TPA: ABC transporter ATP-binding protein [Bacteroidia bacterium]|nr:ABC transporter ATP-binding protein [Bacteroidia bacterium]HRS58033.1 ABC transporter ATP-binding protein [Bacteroidia bacterium]HRU68858.1 ABC transporter ATP-binding protein [Bacteroidia bacterium]
MGELKNIIQVQDFSFAYEERLVLKNITLELKPSCFHVILGQNGSGKSTLLRSMAGMLPVQKQKIFIASHDITEMPLKTRAKTFGLLSQKHKAVFPFSVEDVVMTGRAAFISFVPKEKDRLIVHQTLEKTGILHLKDRCYTELSGGEQQLAMIARVLAQQAPLLFLDEPTTHLDFYNQEKVLSLIKNLTQEGLSVVAVLHDPSMAFLFGDHFIFLKNGRLVNVPEGKMPWDADFLENIYEMKLEAIPHAKRALIVPSNSGK